MTTVAAQPSSPAANATPWAWLPALAATTPRARSASESLAILLYAPRTLNDPVRCRFSHLRNTGPPTVSDSTRECSTGVSEITSWISLRAAVTSSELTAPGVMFTGLQCAIHPRARRPPAGSRADAKTGDHDILSNGAATQPASHQRPRPRHPRRAARQRPHVPRRQGRDQGQPARHDAGGSGPLSRHCRLRPDRPASPRACPDRRARHYPARRAWPG